MMNALDVVKHALGGQVKMDELPRELRANDVFGLLAQLLRNQERIMSALTDLEAAVSAAVAEIQSLKSQLAAVPPPVAASSVSDEQAETLAATLNAAVNPPAVAPAEAAAPVTPAAPAEAAPAAPAA